MVNKLSLLAALMFAGCSRVVESSSRIFYNTYGRAFPASYAGTMTAILTNKLTGTGAWSPFTHSFAGFRDRSGRFMTLSGGVSLNGMTLPHPQFYDRHSEWDSAATGWGGVQVWSVSDTTQVGTFSDTLVAPNTVTISYPQQLMHHDSVSRSGGCTVAFSAVGADSIWIEANYVPGLSHGIDTSLSLSDTMSVVHIGPLANTGTAYVSPNTLAVFPTKGVILFRVIAVNAKTSMHYGRHYAISSISVAEVLTFIKP